MSGLLLKIQFESHPCNNPNLLSMFGTITTQAIIENSQVCYLAMEIVTKCGITTMLYCTKILKLHIASGASQTDPVYSKSKVDFVSNTSDLQEKQLLTYKKEGGKKTGSVPCSEASPIRQNDKTTLTSRNCELQ